MLFLVLAACSSERAVSMSGEGDPSPPAGDAVVVEGWEAVAPADVPAACDDDRFPALAGRLLVGCTVGGVDFVGGPLAVAVEAPALGEDVVVSLGMSGARFRPGAEREPLGFVPAEAVGPPATDGDHLAVAYADHVEAFAIGDRVRRHVEARPVPGEPVAMAWPEVVWVQRGDGLDLWRADAAGHGVLLAGGPGDQHLPAGAGGKLAWVDAGAVVLYDPATGATEPHAAETGFAGGLAFDGARACWADRGAWRARGGALDDALGVGIRCSDGATLDLPGDDLYPSLGAGRLLFRREGRPWLATPAGG